MITSTEISQGHAKSTRFGIIASLFGCMLLCMLGLQVADELKVMLLDLLVLGVAQPPDPPLHVSCSLPRTKTKTA
jgi:hypothetical protein